MAEICCEVAMETEAMSKAIELSPRALRRRRLELRRFKFVAEVESEAVSDEIVRKRQKLEKDSILDLRSSADVEASCLRYGKTSVIGRRRDMEDAVSIRPDFVKFNGGSHFFGVFDGHGCSHVAVSCKERMHEIVSEEMGRIGTGSGEDSNWKRIMETSFARMDGEVASRTGGAQGSSCRCELQTPKCELVGSTAVVAVVDPARIVVSNCGDSRAVLCRKGEAVPLSSDHKPDRPDELSRIEDAGGRVIYWDGARVLGVLAMSRAIGDGYLKPFVISEPEVTVTERNGDDECLILASDGLWDVVSNEMACHVARICLHGNARGSGKACSDAAVLLTKLALARHSADNISVVVVDLRRSL